MRGELLPGDVEVADGRVVGVGVRPKGKRGIAVPGLVDLQVNGFAGVDLLGASPAEWAHVREALLETGVTSYQPTFITSPEDVLVDALRSLPADVVGAQLEGPFLAENRLGAHPAAHRRDPDVALLDRLLAAGRVTTLTLAPELPGAPGLIRHARECGLVVGAGHSDATADEANAAFDLGVSTVNHVFNAMRPFTQREPGIGGAALVRPDVVVQMIVDGRHLADDTVRLVWGAAGGRVALVSDGTAASAAGPGTYRLGEAEITVVDGVPLRADGTLAGTALTLIGAVRNLHALGVRFEEAVGAATTVPARVLGRRDLGVLDVGGRADVVVLDDRLEVLETRSVISD